MIAKTLVEEARRTWRSIGNSTITRPFNAWAVEKLREKETDKAKKDNIVRVRGSKRIEMFNNFLNEFRKMVRKALKDVTPEQYKTIFASIEKADNKASAAETKETEDSFERGLKKPVKTYQAELVTGYNLTAMQKGQVIMQQLSKKSGLEHLVDDELRARKIHTNMNEFISKYGEDADLSLIGITEKKHYIKLDKARRMVMENQHTTVEDAMKKATKIKPISASLREFMLKEYRQQDNQEENESNNQLTEQNETS